MSVILFIIIIGILVFVHELGHFLVAKRFGIRVDEFAIGFPPRVLSHKVGETDYSLNFIPIGGYVKIFGEDLISVPSSHPDRLRSFTSKNRGVQAAVLVAGVVANIIFAWVLLSAAFMIGTPVSTTEQGGMPLTDERLFIVEVLGESPAKEAGLRAGDTIRYIEDANQRFEAKSVSEIQQFIASRGGQEIKFGIERKNGRQEISVIPEKNVIGDTPGIGISLDLVGTLKLPFFHSLWEGAKRTVDLFIMTAKGIGAFFYRIVSFNADFSTIAGPVGIAALVSDAQSLGWFYLVSFTAIISLNLAIINLIPFPALDGGRLLFVMIESITRKPLPAKFIRSLNAAGFVILLAFLLFVTYKDVLRFF